MVLFYSLRGLDPYKTTPTQALDALTDLLTGTTITCYLGSFRGVNQVKVLFPVKELSLKTLDATTVVAPAKIVIVPWTFGTWE